MPSRFFALAMPGRPELFPFGDDAATFYRDCGYTGVYLENDYARFGSPASFGCWRSVNEVVSLWRFSRDDKAAQYLEWIAGQIEIAHRNGLKLYLKVWEPRVPTSQRDRIPEKARSGAPRDPNAVPPNVCLRSPQGKAFIREFHEEALGRLEGIDGLIVGVDDNWAELCSDACPYCKDVHLYDRAVEYFQLLHEVVGAVRPELDVILYDWLWKEGEFTSDNLVNRYLEKGPGAVRVVTRFTQWARQELPAYSGEASGILDCTLTVDGPGPVTESYLPQVQSGRLRLLDMFSTGNSSEAWAHPPVPAPAAVFRRLKGLDECGFDGFVDYDCGTLVPSTTARALTQYMRGVCTDSADAFLDRLALDTYGPEAVSAARQAWDLCRQGLRAYPLDMQSSLVFCLVGRMGLSLALTIGMVPDPGRFAGEDYHSKPHWIYPYSVLMPDVIEAQEKQLAAVVEAMERADDFLRRAVDLATPGNRSFAEMEADRARALYLMYASQHNWACMAKRTYAGEKPTPPGRPGWVRDCLLRERDLTEEYAGLHAKDRLLFSNPTWDIVGIVALCEPERAIDRDKPFESKIASLNRCLGLDRTD